MLELINCLIVNFFRQNQEQQNPNKTDCTYNDDKGYVNFKSFLTITIN